MSQPSSFGSQTLKVLRKRGRDPVDTLIVEFEEPNSKRRNTEQFVFRRIKDINDHKRASSASPAARSTARTGLLGKDLGATSRGTQNGSPLAVSETPGDQPGTPTSDTARSSASAPPSYPAEPRRFHLSRQAITAHEKGSPGDANKGRGRKPNVAVFVERIQSGKRARGDDDASAKPAKDGGAGRAARDSEMDIDAQATRRKRPGASAEEKQWRAASRTRAAAIETKPSDTKKISPEFLEKMQKFAEEVQTEEKEQEQVQQKKTEMKYKPKAPQLRYKDRHPEEFTTEHNDDEMDIDESGDGEYVYDTYVRHHDPSIQLSKDGVLEGKNEDGNFGFLVITGEDEPFWELYAEDMGVESDKEFDTDYEDENAENFYGADYPEDEVDSDDEYDMGAYKFRHGASDDEEYDVNRATYSDEEEDLRYPWKRNVWAHSRGGEGDSDVESV